MRKHFFTFLLFFPLSIWAQDAPIPKFAKTAIGNSGCSAYLPAEMPAFDLSFSEDNAEVYTAEVETGGLFFACIAVKFSEPFGDEITSDYLEKMVISYLNYLKSVFSITGAAGYGTGHTLEGYPDAYGILDYWESADSMHYVVKGWVNKEKLGVLLIGKQDTDPAIGLQNLYLNGWRFD